MQIIVDKILEKKIPLTLLAFYLLLFPYQMNTISIGEKQRKIKNRLEDWRLALEEKVLRVEKEQK